MKLSLEESVFRDSTEKVNNTFILFKCYVNIFISGYYSNKKIN